MQLKKKLSKNWNALSKVEKKKFHGKVKGKFKSIFISKGYGSKSKFFVMNKALITKNIVANYINVNMFDVFVSFQLYLQTRGSPK